MNRSGGRGGPRSNIYSSQRFTNWTPHDPHWSEAQALPAAMRPVAELPREGDPLGVFERHVAPGFVRPWTTPDIVEVLGGVPREFLAGLDGVFSMGGTAKQLRLQVLTFGMYSRGRVYLFPVPKDRLVRGWRCSAKANEVQRFRRFGATVSGSNRGTSVVFNEDSLRRFYLYDVLLHEVGHHNHQVRSRQESERFARWFAEFQHSHLAS